MFRPVGAAADRNVLPPDFSGKRVELQLFTTLRCNLKCSYCSVAEGDVLGSQGDVSYSLDALDAFIRKFLSDSEVYVTFYGGEPTLNLEFMQKVMERYPLFRYQLQTNGTLLDSLPYSVLSKLSNILISIDGAEKTTDHYRGKGIYRQVMNNVDTVRHLVGGTLTARMTWSHDEISFEEIDELANRFDYLYFQFVAGEAYAPAGIESRKAVLTKLIDRFFSSADKLYPVIPLMGIVRNKVFPSRALIYGGKTQCRVSSNIINIMPDGKVFPCPDMLYLPELQQGDIIENWLGSSGIQQHPNMPCKDCEAYAWCRGNCMKNLYLAYVKGNEQYRKNVTEPICDLVRFVGTEIDRHSPRDWYVRLPVSVRKQLVDCEVFDYVEVMP